MKKIIVSAVLALFLVSGFAPKAYAEVPVTPAPIGGHFAKIFAAHHAKWLLLHHPLAMVGGGTAGSIPLFVGAGMVAPIVLTGLIANQVDPWHPLACALFGDEGRVGNDKDSACNH